MTTQVAPMSRPEATAVYFRAVFYAAVQRIARCDSPPDRHTLAAALARLDADPRELAAEAHAVADVLQRSLRAEEAECAGPGTEPPALTVPVPDCWPPSA